MSIYFFAFGCVSLYVSMTLYCYFVIPVLIGRERRDRRLQLLEERKGMPARRNTNTQPRGDAIVAMKAKVVYDAKRDRERRNRLQILELKRKRSQLIINGGAAVGAIAMVMFALRGIVKLIR